MILVSPYPADLPGTAGLPHTVLPSPMTSDLITLNCSQYSHQLWGDAEQSAQSRGLGVKHTEL